MSENRCLCFNPFIAEACEIHTEELGYWEYRDGECRLG